MRNRLIINLIFLSNSLLQAQNWQISAPASERYCEINTTGETIIPTIGRIIKPMGKTYRIAPHPYGLVLSPDGKTVITANSGTNPFSISILQNIFSPNPTVRQIPDKSKTDDDLLGAVFMGLAISPNNKTVYVSGGTTNKIFLFDIVANKKIGEISYKSGDYTDGYIGDMVMTRDGSTLYAVDQIGFRMLIIDTKTRKIMANVPTGRYPFGITLSPDEKTVYVANVGMFQYSFVKGIDRSNKQRLKETVLKFPHG